MQWLNVRVCTGLLWCVRAVLASSTFEQVRHSPAFIDKTAFIHAYFTSEVSPLVISAPHGFGKTSNLLMLQSYLSRHDNATHWESLFRGTAIHDTHAAAMRSYDNYTVLYCSFRQEERLVDHEAMLMGFRGILHRTFTSYSYLMRSRKLSRYDKKRLTIYTGVKKHLKMTAHHIATGLFYLSKLMRKHHERPLLLALDDYDSVLLDCLFSKGLEVRPALAMHHAVFSAALHLNPHVSRVVLVGATSTLAKPFTRDHNLTLAGFLQHPAFTPFFGITDSELDLLLSTERFGNYSRDVVRRWYGGYTSPDMRVHTYNVQSTVHYLLSGELRSYWRETRETRTLRLLMIEPTVQTMLNDSSRYEVLEVDCQERLTTRHLEGVKALTSTELWDDDYAGPFLSLLRESGYYTLARPWDPHAGTVSLRAPNEDLRSVFEQIGVAFLQDPLDLLERLKEAVHTASFGDQSDKPPAAEEVEALISTITKPDDAKVKPPAAEEVDALISTITKRDDAKGKPPDLPQPG